jgi:carbon monoxide dehydrogenase subunit G
MKIENAFDVPLSRADAWITLLDIPRIAPCLPGTKLLDVEGEGRYRGEVQVRLGPVMLTFKGRAEIVERDDEAYTAKVVADGRDAKGRGGAKATVDFRLVSADVGTRVEIETDLTLSGSIAQYGRASGMIEDVAGHMIGEFAACLRGEIGKGAPADETPPDETPADETPADETPPDETPSDPSPSAARPAFDPTPDRASAQQVGDGQQRAEGPPASAERAARPISGLRLGLWLAWRQILRLFGRN